jgi:hypothetical protein
MLQPRCKCASHETRIKDLEAGMAEALAIYQKSPKAPNAQLPAIDKRKGAPKKKDGATAFAPGNGAAGAVGRAVFLHRPGWIHRP